MCSRLRAKGSRIVAVSCHPGVCRTDLGRYYFTVDGVPKALAPLAAGAALLIGLPFGTSPHRSPAA